MRKSLNMLVVGLLCLSAIVEAQEGVIRSKVDPVVRSHADVVAYWTKERMLNAKPYDVLPPAGPSFKRTVSPSPSGTPGFISSSEDGSQMIEFSLDHPAIKSLLEEPQLKVNGYDYPPPENTYAIPASWYGSFGIRNVGKIFFTMGGLGFVCSGSAIGGRAVITAGHCLSNGQGNFHDNWVFVPAYKNGAAPYGAWSQFDAIVFTSWHFAQDLCRDVGAAVVSDIGGLKLAQVVGNLGFSWNQPRVQSWSNHGYPAEAPFSGLIQVETTASYSFEESPGGCTPNTMAMGSRQTGGSSGGPWIRVYRPQSSGPNNFVNSVNSYGYPALPNEIYGPYFDDSVKTVIYDWAIAQ